LLTLILQDDFLHFKCYNLAMYVVNFFEIFSTHYFSSLSQDPMVGSQENNNNLIYAICNLVLECFFVKHSHGPLGVNEVTVSISMFDLFLCFRITPKCRFHLTCFCTCLKLFLREQWMQVHDMAKYEWSLFTRYKWV
jgi:hypothetical protein